MPLALTANDYDPAVIARASGKGATLSSDVATVKGHAPTAPTTTEPTIEVPTTLELATVGPSYDEPTTEASTTSEPPTAILNTSEPETDGPTTDEPPTDEPTTANETSTDVPIVGRTIFWLTSVVHPYHSSSALQTLVRSSPAAATPCSMKYKLKYVSNPRLKKILNKPVWQCEPNKVLIDNQTLRIAQPNDMKHETKSERARVTSLKRQGVLRE